MSHQITVLVASPLEPELVEQIRRVDPRIEVLFAPELLPVPRYPADHGGVRRELSAEANDRWSTMLARADVLFDFEWRSPADIPTSAPNVKWVQATSAGIGSFVARTGLDSSGIVFTTAAGVHAVPLAEFALTGVLYFAKGIPFLTRQQREHHWERYATSSVRGRTAVVVGLGSIGGETVRMLAGAGLTVWGVGRPGSSYDIPEAAKVVSTDQLEEVLPHADVLVLATPLTAETNGLINRERIGLLPAGAIVVNIARGQVIDQTALFEALESGHLGGAALDVFDVEPLPADSPLWDRSDVLISPHSASTLSSENEALVTLFSENLRRYVSGEPLLNQYQPDKGY